MGTRMEAMIVPIMVKMTEGTMAFENPSRIAPMAGSIGRVALSAGFPSRAVAETIMLVWEVSSQKRVESYKVQHVVS